jgi:methylenetetrahydrofolate reductase (NADPH)
MTTTTNNFAHKLISGQAVVTAECLPPRGADAEAMKRLSAALPDRLDAIVVSDSSSEIHGSPLGCAALLTKQGRTAILTMLTRDRNRVALESDALAAATLGIHGILSLSGDHQSLGPDPEAAGAYDIDSIQFTKMLKDLTMGLDPRGRSFNPKPEWAVGAVVHPYLQPAELNLIRLKKKVAAGADFLLTPAIFDLAGFVQWLGLARATGIDQKAAIIASVLPLTSVKKADRLKERKSGGIIGEALIARLTGAVDPAKEGVAIAAEIAVQLKSIPGIRGIHILSGGCESLAAEVMKGAGLI